MSKIAKTMTDLLKVGENGFYHGPISPSAATWQSFRQLEAAFIFVLVLVHFDWAKQVGLETDALGYTIVQHHFAAGRRGPGG